MLLQRRRRSVSETTEALAGHASAESRRPLHRLWSRLQAFRPEELAELMLSRQAVRSTLMRGTIHLVTVRDCLAFRPLVQSIMERRYVTGRAFGRRLKDVEVHQVTAACVELLRSGPLTRSELKARLAERWPAPRLACWSWSANGSSTSAFGLPSTGTSISMPTAPTCTSSTETDIRRPRF